MGNNTNSDGSGICICSSSDDLSYWQSVGLGIVSLLLGISELLPFVKRFNFNGLLQFLTYETGNLARRLRGTRQQNTTLNPSQQDPISTQ